MNTNITSFTSSAMIPEKASPIDRQGTPDAAHAPSPFESILTERTNTTRQTEAKQAANQLVASTFIIPILSKLRETSWAEGPFAPGMAEKRFGPMLDQHIADRIVEASNFDLVDAIAERYARPGHVSNHAHSHESFERIA